MPEIRIANLADGRTIDYYANRLELGGVITEPFYLGAPFGDVDIHLWVRAHRNIKFITFAVGAILSGERIIDETELMFLLGECTSSQDQFFDMTLQVAANHV